MFWKQLFDKELHKKLKKLTFLSERMKIGNSEKLVSNLKDKKTYVIHIKKLRQALKNGLKMKKAHQLIRFEKSYWMKPYIMLNTKLRIVAKNEFKKEFSKLMNKTAFGKTMENIRSHKNKPRKICQKCDKVKL